MNKKISTLLFAAALCGVQINFAHDAQTIEVGTQVVDTCCCVEVIPAQEVENKVIESTEVSLTEQELPELTADEEEELEKLIAELIKAQQEQEALAAQEQK
ncbi:MAG: hypothetical protein P4L31_08430 [Candidatus Babeliales bacterium]|nr:hypothetical protein [Candidatus Babeliales bacterium]